MGVSATATRGSPTGAAPSGIGALVGAVRRRPWSWPTAALAIGRSREECASPRAAPSPPRSGGSGDPCCPLPPAFRPCYGSRLELPEGASVLTPEVRDANAVVAQRQQIVQQAHAELRASTIALREAAPLDREHIAWGEAIPRDRIEAAARRAHEEAAARAAARGALDDATVILARTIAGPRAEWVPAQEAVVAEIAEEIELGLDGRRARVSAVRVARPVLGGLREFPTSGGSLVGVLFDYVIRADPERNHERAVERGELSDTRAHVHRDLDPFVATLIAAGRAA